MSLESDESRLYQTWEELLSSINPGGSVGERAVHQPLLILLLLARARQGGSNRVPFPEIDRYLTTAIRRFGPAPNPGGAELPFWHLKNDSFWFIEKEEHVPLQAEKNRPTKGTLVELNVTGYVPLLLWQQLTRSEHLVEQLAASLVNTYWSSPDARAAVLRYFDLRIPSGTEVKPDQT